MLLLAFYMVLPISSVAESANPFDYDRLLDEKYSLFPHKGTYVLPFSYNFQPHNDLYANVVDEVERHSSDFYSKQEAEFQISFSLPVIRHINSTHWDIMAAYTHHSWWQVYNSAWSKPFRETNYEPELFVRRYLAENVVMAGHLSLRAYDMGYVHQSNGQIQVLSRSWDRLFARAYARSEEWLFTATVWVRIPESVKEDDNPGIYDYYGFGNLNVMRNVGRHTVSMEVPLQFSHLSVDFKYTYPWKNHLRWMLSWQYGYAHSLIEYDRSVNRVAVGLALESFFDKE